MLRCAMCGKVLKECCDIYEEAEDTTTGETVYLCGDCAAQVEAWAGLADYKPEDQQLREFWERQEKTEFCDRHECREQKEEEE